MICMNPLPDGGVFPVKAVYPDARKGDIFRNDQDSGGGNGVSIKAGDGCGGRFPEDI